jgi:ABC-type nitrate/sulfonate/bicarbonate transport system substrate-binding protein
LPSLALYTRRTDIKSLKDLEGRTVGVGSIGALLYQLVVALLRKNHVDVSKVRFVNIGASGDVFRATRMGTVDAGTGEVAMLDHVGQFGLRLVPGGNMAKGLRECTFQGAWTSDREIHDKRDVLVRTLAAYAKMYRFVQTPQAKGAFFKAWLAMFPNSSKADAGDSWNYIQHYKPFAVDLVIDQKRIDYMQQLNVDLGIQSSVLPYDRVADMSLAREAVKLLA